MLKVYLHVPMGVKLGELSRHLQTTECWLVECFVFRCEPQNLADSVFKLGRASAFCSKNKDWCYWGSQPSLPVLSFDVRAKLSCCQSLHVCELRLLQTNSSQSSLAVIKMIFIHPHWSPLHLNCLRAPVFLPQWPLYCPVFQAWVAFLKHTACSHL